MKQIHFIIIISFLLILVGLLSAKIYSLSTNQKRAAGTSQEPDEPPSIWAPPDTANIPMNENGNRIRYGRALITHTARYFGPEGSISKLANGLNCQNCHLAAGTRLFANNFSQTASAYPRFRPRAGLYISLADRVNGCMQRSMNGQAIDTTSEEMRAFIAYFEWIGKGLDAKNTVYGSGTETLPLLNRAADPLKGQAIFINNCASCHGTGGEGTLNLNTKEYLYPPLWGPHSYNMGAGMYRLSKFASFIKNNMPFGTTYHNPVLTDEQAWDVAAFVNSQPHPQYKAIQNDWQNIASKPFDYPFGPYADTFSEKQHKYGPFFTMKK